MPLSNTHSHPQSRTRSSASRLIAVATASALSLGFLVAQAPQQAAAASRQLIVNGNFSGGSTGWRTDDAAAHPLATTGAGREGSQGAEIVTKNTSPVVLTDAKSTVPSTRAEGAYKVVAYVRSDRAGGTAQLLVEERSSSNSDTFRTSIVPNTTKWTKLVLDVDPKTAGSALDLNVVFSGAAEGQKLYVDDVSFRDVTDDVSSPNPPTSQPTAPPTQPSTPPATGMCTRPAPPKGTQFGSSISTTSTIWAEHALADRDSIFGKIAAVRIWDQPMPFSWQDRRTPYLEGRTLVMSFRPAPADVLSGKHDAELRAWFEQAPSSSTIYWNYYHEPETPIDDQGKFSADQYIKAWRHIDKIADSVCRQNMYATLVLMGWTTSPSSKKDWRKYYAGDDVIDVLAFDPYNGVHDPDRDFYATPSSMLDSIVSVSKEAGKPWGLAEIGSRKIPSDTTGSARAAWLTSIAEYTRKNGALFVTYFHSTNGAEWRLLDKPSQDAWRAAVSSSPR